MSTTTDAENFVHDRLSALVGGRVYSGIAPATATEPFIVFDVRSPGSDRDALSGDRYWSDPLVIVKAIAKAKGWSTLDPLADAIDAALQNTSGGDVILCRRVAAFRMIETPDGVQWRHLGGEYRLSMRGI